jgi:sugar lactone lactonase YvrE
MAKAFPFIWVLLFFFVWPADLNAQTQKLTGAFNYSSGIVIDSKGNAFVTGKNNRIIKITPQGKAGLFAGGGKNYTDGAGKNFRFYGLGGIAIDTADNLYVTDNTGVRKLTPEGIVTSVAGMNNKAASTDGNRTTASFLHLENIAIAENGNIYVTDYAPGKDWKPGQATNSTYYYIRKITVEGQVTTLQNGSEGPLQLQYPRGLACDKENNLYICASASHCIKKITQAGSITTIAGQCDKTIYHSVYKEGSIATAVLTTPTGIAIAKNGDIYISDGRINRIIKITNNKVSTVAGCGKISFAGNIAGASETGETDGKAMQATFFSPSGIAFDKTGNLYIVDGSSRNNSYIRRLSADGMVSTFCKHVWNPTTQQYEEAE